MHDRSNRVLDPFDKEDLFGEMLHWKFRAVFGYIHQPIQLGAVRWARMWFSRRIDGRGPGISELCNGDNNLLTLCLLGTERYTVETSAG